MVMPALSSHWPQLLLFLRIKVIHYKLLGLQQVVTAPLCIYREVEILLQLDAFRVGIQSKLKDTETYRRLSERNYSMEDKNECLNFMYWLASYLSAIFWFNLSSRKYFWSFWQPVGFLLLLFIWEFTEEGKEDFTVKVFTRMKESHGLVVCGIHILFYLEWH